MNYFFMVYSIWFARKELLVILFIFLDFFQLLSSLSLSQVTRYFVTFTISMSLCFFSSFPVWARWKLLFSQSHSNTLRTKCNAKTFNFSITLYLKRWRKNKVVCRACFKAYRLKFALQKSIVYYFTNPLVYVGVPVVDMSIFQIDSSNSCNEMATCILRKKRVSCLSVCLFLLLYYAASWAYTK